MLVVYRHGKLCRRREEKVLPYSLHSGMVWLKSSLLEKMLKIFDLVALLIYPLEPTSNGTKRHLYPLSSKSFFNVVYLRDFLRFAASAFLSKLHVSSSKANCFLISVEKHQVWS